VRVLAISGSLRRESHNSALLRAAAHVLPPGVELEVLEPVVLKSVPAFDADDEASVPREVTVLREAVGAAEAVLIATPEYNSSIPGALKNAIDWASRPTVASGALANKPVAVIGASPSMFGAVWAQGETRKVLASAGARVVDRELPVAGAHDAFTADGRLAEHDLELELSAILAELVAEARETARVHAAA